MSSTRADAIQIHNLSVDIDSAGKRMHVIQDLSLSLRQGEILAIVGESGCGKSMLCKSIMGLLPPSASVTGGAVMVQGENLLSLSEKEMCSRRKKDLSMVFQDPMTSLDPTIPVGRQIAVAGMMQEPAMSFKEAEKKAVKLMQMVGIDRAWERKGQYPWQLSGGMRQRCVLAAALACHPKVLIADEPTTALDVTVQAQILQLLKKIQKETGISILFITHDLGVVAGMADRVSIMQEGRIVETQPVDAIFASPRHPYTKKLLESLPANAPAFLPAHSQSVAVQTSEDSASQSAEPVLQISHLSHAFKLGRRSFVHAASDVSFRIQKGEIFSLVGESGSGKSTIARCLLGLYRPLAGNMLYRGIDIHAAGISREEARRVQREIQYISQDSSTSLNPHMTVGEIIEEPLKLYRMFENRSAREAYVKEMLCEVMLSPDLIDRPVTMLSGGQRQRVSIARAFGAQPALLVADEPLASLDVTMQMQIVRLFAHLIEEHDASMLFIAHDLSMVRFLSSRVGVMYRGRLVEVAETEELYRNPVHPYTRCLLAAMPVPDPAREREKEIPLYEDKGNLGDSYYQVSQGHYVLMPESGAKTG